MTQIANTNSSEGAAEFTRPLLLTPSQDRLGWTLAKAGRGALLGVTAVSVMAVALIFFFIAKEAWPFFTGHGLGEPLTSTQWYPTGKPTPIFGMLALIFGSLYVTAGALFIAAPAGLLAAILLSDIVPFGVRQAVKPIIELLAAIPSVAFGFFAALVLAPLLEKHLHISSGRDALNSMIMLAIMAIPTIVSVAEDALSAAGRDLREASYACGATRAETLVRVVIPAAHNGIIAAIILGMMRAIGETMLVLMASGNAAHIPSPWWDLTQSVRTLTATIAGEMGETPVGSDHRRALFAVGLILLVFCFVLNLVTEHFLHRVRRAGGHR